MRIALIKNGKVDNIIIADMEFAGELGYDQAIDADSTTIGIGWVFDGEKFTNPIEQELQEPLPVTILTKFQFMSRLTIAERLAIYAAEAGSPIIRMWLEMFKICEEIDTINADTIAGVQMLEQAGLIAEGRAAEILGTNAPNT